MSVSADDIVRLLNDAAALDQDAMRHLIEQRVPCNTALADHPTIQVGSTPDGGAEVGLLGIVNGIAAMLGGLVASKWSDQDGSFMGFCSLEVPPCRNAEPLTTTSPRS